MYLSFVVCWCVCLLFVAVCCGSFAAWLLLVHVPCVLFVVWCSLVVNCCRLFVDWRCLLRVAQWPVVLCLLCGVCFLLLSVFDCNVLSLFDVACCCAMCSVVRCSLFGFVVCRLLLAGVCCMFSALDCALLFNVRLVACCVCCLQLLTVLLFVGVG